ncbi:exocyst complex component SEC8 isoform X2 [Andrographis paniculata]|uniref:exocyst complex component SEC8 isoform X2 n=1 Tax=Andrographis paniculata TaxID=175694 RepID=UPI0021E8D8CA|nr:exocyst complex component SEC8 isoform X2 [Andrographis paniculata]
MSIFDGLPISREKSYLKEELSKVDESWAAARFDSLPHVVHILTSKDREGEVQILKEQSEVIEEVVDEVVHAYHGGFNKAIQNYSQILRLFSESAESIKTLKVDLSEGKKLLGAHNKQLHQFWYRSVTLRHIIALLEQIEGIAKVPARIEKLIAEKQFYAAVQLHVQSTLMLEREGLQSVGALQDIRSELTKLRGTIFYKVFEELHAHLYNKGEYSSVVVSINENDDAIPTSTADGFRRPGSIDGGSSISGYIEDGMTDFNDDADGHTPTMKANNGDTGSRDVKVRSRQIPIWLSDSTPDEFVEAMRKSDAPVFVKYLRTMVECLCVLGKVAAAGAMICQRLRPTVHEIITTKIKAQAERAAGKKSGLGHTSLSTSSGLRYLKGRVEGHHLPQQKRLNGVSTTGALSATSPVSHMMSPSGAAQFAARELLDSILDTVVQIFENHVIVGELLELKSSQQVNLNTPKALAGEISWNHDSDASHDTGGYSIGFSLTVIQSECQQLICEILRATPEAASADASVQTARLAGKTSPSNEKSDGSDDGLVFTFRFTDATVSISNQGTDLLRQGWKKGASVHQEGYGSGTVLPEQGIYLAASLYRPVHKFTDKVASMLPQKVSQISNDGLLSFVENFVKDHFLPTLFVDYRKSVQQAISSPAAFRPRASAAASYTPSVEKGRPVLQGLLAIDFLAKEVHGWAQAMPKFSGGLISYVKTFLERAYERCRTSYMEAVLEKQSYMLIGRHDIERLLRLEPASACLPNSADYFGETYGYDTESSDIENQLSDILLNLRPIKQENLIHDDNKLILLASLSDSLEYVADSIERLGQLSSTSDDHLEENGMPKSHDGSLRGLASFAEEYRRLAIDCLKVLRIEMMLETISHMQEMANRSYMDDQDAEEPDDFVISLTSQISRRDEEMAPYVADVKRNYIFGGICSIAANLSLKVLAGMKSIDLFGVQQICRNSIALEQALAAIPSIDSEVVQMKLDHVRTYYELLNMPFEALLAFISEHETLFAAAEYGNLLKVQVPGREIPDDAMDRMAEIIPL